MIREVVKEGPSVAEAIDGALEELGVQQDAVGYEVLEESRGLLGIGGKAKVRVWLKGEAVAEIEADEEAPDDDEAESEVVDEVAPERGPGPAQADLSEEEVDKVADAAVAALHGILGGFGMSCEIDEYEGDYGEVILDVVGDDVAVLIGRHGRGLEALQVLVTSIAYREVGMRYPILVDVAGYRYRRKAKLDEIARQAADKVRRTGAPVRLRPMSSYERKVVHMALREDNRVVTASEGEEPFRLVVVSPR